MKKRGSFQVARPSRARRTSPATAEAFVSSGVSSGKAGRKTVRQNLWIDPELRIEVGVQARKNGETISDFAARAFRRELSSPSRK